MDLKEIEKQVEEIKARVMADSTILRFAILSQSTEQLLQMKANLTEINEALSVKLLYMSGASDVANETFDQRRSFWMDAIDGEISSRQS